MEWPAGDPRIRDWLTLSAILALFSITIAGSIYQHTMPAGDEPAYLQAALFIRENGGLFNFISLCFNRVYLESNRQPATLLVLSIFAKRDPYFFFIGKAISGVFAIAFIIVCYTIVRRHFGFATAAISCAIMATNVALVVYSGQATCETMLTFFTALTWYLTLRGFEDSRYFALAGLANGLAYMTKASGLLLAIPFAAACLVKYRSKALDNRWFYSYFIMLILVSSPLLARNVLAYGNPFYHASHDVVWFDRWIEYTRLDWGYKVSFLDYLNTHGPQEIISRLACGLAIFLFNTLIQVGGFLGIVFALFLIASVRRQSGETKAYVITLVLVHALSFAWYNPIDADFRFELPITPVLAAYAAMGVAIGLGGESMTVKTIAQTAVAYLSIMLVLMPLTALSDMKERERMGYLKPYIVPSDYKKVMDYFETNIAEGDKLVLVDGSTYSEYYWTSVKLSNLKPLLYPYRIEKAPEILLNEQNITYMLATRGLFDMDPRVGEYLGYDKSRGLYEKKWLPGYSVVFADENSPAQYLVYKRTG